MADTKWIATVMLVALLGCDDTDDPAADAATADSGLPSDASASDGAVSADLDAAAADTGPDLRGTDGGTGESHDCSATEDCCAGLDEGTCEGMENCTPTYRSEPYQDVFDACIWNGPSDGTDAGVRTRPPA